MIHPVQRTLLFALGSIAWTWVILCNPFDAGYSGEFEQHEATETSEIRMTVEHSLRYGFWANYGMLERRDGSGVYSSHPGITGWIPSLLARVPTWTVDQAMATSEMLTALMLGMALTLFGFWVAREFGLATAIVVTALLICSDPLVFIGRNTWRVFHTCLWPFLFSWAVFPRVLDGRVSCKRFAGGLLAFVFLRAAGGYEFITSVIWSATVPPVYFGLKRGLPWRRLLAWIGGLLTVGVAAFLLALFVNLVQTSLYYQSIPKGFEVIAGKALARTYGAETNSTEPGQSGGDARSGELTIPEMVSGCLNQRASSILFGKHSFPINLQTFFAFFALSVPLLFLALADRRFLPVLAKRRQQLLALHAALFWSMAGTLSWLVLAPGWVEHHFHIIAIAFYIVYMPMLFLTLGWIIALLTHQFAVWVRSGKLERDL